jgi:uncharacterized membrane protein
MDNTRLASGLVFMAAIGSGIVAGAFFAFSSFVMPALGRISPTQAVAAMNSINITALNPGFMTPFVGTGVLSLVVGFRSPFLWNHTGTGLALLASLVYLLGCFAATIFLNVPLNNQLASITEPAAAIAFWPQYLKAWTTWNHLRMIAAALSAILFAAALCRS